MLGTTILTGAAIWGATGVIGEKINNMTHKHRRHELKKRNERIMRENHVTDKKQQRAIAEIGCFAGSAVAGPFGLAKCIL